MALQCPCQASFIWAPLACGNLALSSAIVLGTLLNVLAPVQDLIYVLCKANENANFCAELLIRDLSYDNGTAKF